MTWALLGLVGLASSVPRRPAAAPVAPASESPVVEPVGAPS